MEVIGYISLLFVGLILGTLGGGGSILSVPILVYLFSQDAVIASAYSLFIVGTTSLVGCIMKYNAQLVNLRTGFIFGIPSLLAIFITRTWVIPSIPDVIMEIGKFQFTKRGLILGLFALLMIMASFVLIAKNKNPKKAEKQFHSIYLMLLGCLIGFLTGLVGAGGGFLIIPALVYLTDLPFKTAVGTTLMIITANSLIGFVGDVINYPVNWHFLLLITSLAILGIFIAGRSTQKLPNRLLRITFGWLMLVMGVLILVNEIVFHTLV